MLSHESLAIIDLLKQNFDVDDDVDGNDLIIAMQGGVEGLNAYFAPLVDNMNILLSQVEKYLIENPQEVKIIEAFIDLPTDEKIPFIQEFIDELKKQDTP